MKVILIISSFLVYALAYPTYDPIDKTDPETYKNIEILILESAVDQDGGYSYSFENDDGSRAAQEGEHRLVDEDHAIESIRGSYSYNDDKGQPISLTYTADENGFRPVGAHLPTPPPIPAEILASLKFLATAKPFVDDQLYDYKPKKKVFRGHQYNNGNVIARSRNYDRSNDVPEPIVANINDDPEPIVENIPDEASLRSAENDDVIQTETIPESLDMEEKETPAVQSTRESTWDILNETKKKIDTAVKESIDKTSKITLSATSQTAAASIAAIKVEAAKVTDSVKVEVNKINQATGALAQQKPGPAPVVEQKPQPSVPVQQKPEPSAPVEQKPGPSAEVEKEVPGPAETPKEMNEKGLRSDITSSTGEILIETDVGVTEDSPIDINVRLSA